MGLASLVLRAAPLRGLSLLPGAEGTASSPTPQWPDVRLTPHYPAPSPLADILRLVTPGSDSYSTEKWAVEIEAELRAWGERMVASAEAVRSAAQWVDAEVQGCSLSPARTVTLRSGYGIEAFRRTFGTGTVTGSESFAEEMAAWLRGAERVQTAEFEIYGIEQTGSTPLSVRADIRYDLAYAGRDGRREERVGRWHTAWVKDADGAWKARAWQASEEMLTAMRGPGFVDVTAAALGGVDSYRQQMLPGVDHWRTVLDGASGIDIYNNTGLAAGDFDNDGFDDLYVCEPAGLPNRLYRNRGDGTFEDVTEKAGVGVLDNSACALFADFRNAGLQDLLVVCATGPLLFLNNGNGTFSLKKDAFRFARPPQGSFTHAAAADYDGDGRLDVYLCTYMYYLGLDQYHYPIPYYDARNGPPNCLMHNEGDGIFRETTAAAGLDKGNNRYSFACAWGDSNGNGLPDLFLANDFGTSQLYRNNGNGTFTDASKEAGVENVGAGMSCCWSDFENSGRQGVYVASMWEAAGQRVAEQKQFHENAPEAIRALYQRHARGNALYRNGGDGIFENVGHKAGVEMGRWSWCSDFWDFDHDGYADLYVTNGYISGPDRDDLASFFWRQVVAKSPEDAAPSPPYERGWGAINELVRSDHTWHGYARNVMFANNRDGTFSEVSTPAGLDFRDDSRAFALADLDHDGRLEIILKNRNGPQIRVLRNAMEGIGESVAFRLIGQTGNRDAIGASVTVQAGELKQTKYLQAGSGFLAQHTKEVFFGVGKDAKEVQVTVRWRGGLTQHFERVPVGHRVEIREGTAAFAAMPFAATAAAWKRAEKPASGEPLPQDVETWLLEPLAAPEIGESAASLAALRGLPVLLYFWAAANPACGEQLRLLEKHGGALKLVAVNVDAPDQQQNARRILAQAGWTGPAVFASEDTAGTYNIIYRYLFDRRRDLAIPTGFLLDAESRIVKVYQERVDTLRVAQDAQNAAADSTARVGRALPFRGQLYQGSFQRNDFTYGVAMFQHGYLDEAERRFQEVLASKPDDPEACYNLGTLRLRRNDLAGAQKYLERTVQLKPDYPEAWNNLGMIAGRQGRAEEAVRDFRQSLLLRPGYAIALLNLGNLYRSEGDWAHAEECLREAVTAQPEDAAANYSLGMLYAEQNQMQQAADYLGRAIALRPEDARARSNYGVLLVHMQDYAQAEEQFRKCIEAAPDFDQPYLNLASLYAMRGDQANARKVLETLLRIQPENQNAQQALGMLGAAR